MSLYETTYTVMPNLKILLELLLKIQSRKMRNERCSMSGIFFIKQRSMLLRNCCFVYFEISF